MEVEEKRLSTFIACCRFDVIYFIPPDISFGSYPTW